MFLSENTIEKLNIAIANDSLIQIIEIELDKMLETMNLIWTLNKDNSSHFP